MLKLLSLIGFLFFSILATADELKNSIDLIEEAQSKGLISAAQASLYKSMSMRGNPELPAEYQGDPGVPRQNGAPGHLYLSELSAAFNELTNDEQIQALKLMSPPAYVWNSENKDNDDDLPQPTPGQNWTYIETTLAKIWYQNGDPNGEQYAKIINLAYSDIENRLSTLMGKSILPDDDESYEYTTKGGKKVIMGNGGNGKMDIYLLPCPVGTDFRGYTSAYKTVHKGVPTPSFIVLDTTDTMSELRLKSVLGHELMHALQFTFPKVESHLETFDVGEGVAKWSEDFLFKNSQFEHEWYEFARYGWLSLLDQSYATWTFYYYLTHEHGLDKIRGIYSAMAALHPYDAIDSIAPGGFKKTWPAFTVKEWNQLPTEESFIEWDGFKESPYQSKTKEVETKSVEIDLTKGDFVDKYEFKLKPLARNYHAYKISHGIGIRSFSVNMGHFFQKEKISLKALIKYSGAKGWKVEDWNSQMEDKELCMDIEDERIDKIIIIYSNFSHKKNDSVDIRAAVKATNLGCLAYKGKIKGTVKTVSGASNTVIETDADVRFKAAPRIGAGGIRMPGRFELLSINLVYSFNSVQNDCSASKADSIELAGPDLKKYGAIGLYPYHTREIPNTRMLNGGIAHPLPKPIPVTYYCGNGKTYQSVFYLYPWIIGNFGAGFKKIDPQSGKIAAVNESVIAPQAGQEVKYTYDLNPYSEGQ